MPTTLDNCTCDDCRQARQAERERAEEQAIIDQTVPEGWDADDWDRDWFQTCAMPDCDHDLTDEDEASDDERTLGICASCVANAADNCSWACESCGYASAGTDWDYELNRVYSNTHWAREEARGNVETGSFRIMQWMDWTGILAQTSSLGTEENYYCEACDIDLCGDCSHSHDEDDDYDDDEPGHRDIHSYSYKPAPEFHYAEGERAITRAGAKVVRTQPLFIGYELEMEDARDHTDTIKSAFEDGFVYLKYDGSLGDDGVELVTHPGTFRYHMEATDWDGYKRMVAEGCRSFGYDSTGMHVHVNRAAFTRSHLWRFLVFHFHNVTEVQAIAQRGNVYYSNWSEWLPERPKALKFAKGEDIQRFRSCAVNMSPGHTIELRYFKGNLKPEAVRRNLQWVHALYEWTRTLTGPASKKPPRFADMVPFLRVNAGTYPDLVNFLAHKEMM